MEISALTTYLIAITLLTITPGVDTMLIIRNTARGGWRDGAGWTATLATGSTTRGITAYGDSASLKYQVAGRGKSGDLALVLSSGQ